MDPPVRRNATTVKTGTVKPARGGTRPREIWFLRSEAQSPRQGSAPRAEARRNLLTRQATFPGGDRRFFSLYRARRPFSVVLFTPMGWRHTRFRPGHGPKVAYATEMGRKSPTHLYWSGLRGKWRKTGRRPPNRGHLVGSIQRSRRTYLTYAVGGRSGSKGPRSSAVIAPKARECAPKLRFALKRCVPPFRATGPGLVWRFP